MLKKLISIVLSISLLLCGGSLATAADQPSKITVRVDNAVIDFPDAQPFINEDGRTMVPLRFVSTALGAEVDWNGGTQLVTITRGELRIALVVGRSEAIVHTGTGDTKRTFDTRAVIKDDRTFVPLRFVSETLGAGVAWDSRNKTVIIRSDGTVEQVPQEEGKLVPDNPIAKAIWDAIPNLTYAGNTSPYACYLTLPDKNVKPAPTEAMRVSVSLKKPNTGTITTYETSETFHQYLKTCLTLLNPEYGEEIYKLAVTVDDSSKDVYGKMFGEYKVLIFYEQPTAGFGDGTGGVTVIIG
ncbi:MAG: copper amine oxidase N-terminal domain-containing protein [Clostridiales bacterium]|jgi:hypothetical protein|nr:copper amine oxidase N-terminal domain-containing protein [Eubacteriales bacterium]MDH7566139.1 copper amine oxidase N-terminal domain-containing protein [Clostridiales bacterium]